MKTTVLFFIAIFFFSGISQAQLVITNEPSAVALAQQLVGPGVVLSNVSFTGNPLMAGHFKNNGGTALTLDSGIVLTTGRAKTGTTGFNIGLEGSGTTEAQFSLADNDWLLPGDAQLATETDANINDLFDACVLEFDMTPLGDSIKFNYVFSSEEYTSAFVCSYNDAFAFFISGPGITGVRNIALVPGTNIPVSIYNVNDVLFGFCPNNTTYFHDNIDNTFFTHDGHTVALTASTAVQPCNSYHLKLVIADFGDGLLDSGVFLEAESLISNEPPLLESVSAASSCGGNQVTVNFSENIICSSIQNPDFAITGPGGPYTVTGWSSPGCSAGDNADNIINFIVNPPITTNGVFQVCLTNVAGSVTDDCGNVAPVACLSFNVGSTTPIFNPVAPICAGATAPVLPAVSNNGVSGTWSPSTVSNINSGVYVFTPSTGQCAVNTSLSVTVTAAIVPIFNAIAPVCSGSTSPSLPGTSINGINGSWSPSVINNSISGIYTFTPGTGQCASTTTLPVAVVSVVTSTTNTAICNNQLPYSWNGNNYSTAGTYPVNLTSSSGCDSVATLNLSINSVVSSTTNTSICNNQLPYSWNGNNYSTAGTYSINLISSSGCDSVATLNLSINSVVSSTTNTSICNNQLPYSWNGNNYSTAGTYSINLTSSSGCDSVATLNLSINSVVSSTTNISICNNQLPYSWNGNNYSTGGTYSINLTSSSGCDSVATLTLTVNINSSSTNAASICSNQLPYSWNGNNYSTTGSYSITLINSLGCDSVATLNLTVNDNSVSTSTATVCSNQLPYSWNGNNYSTSGTYAITLINSLGCDSVATLNLTVNDNSASTSTATVCSNQLPYSWNGNNYSTSGLYAITLINSLGCDSVATLDLTVNDNSVSTSTATVCSNQLPYSWNGNDYSTTGSYSITLINSLGCDSVATLNLTVNDNSVSISTATVCNNQLPYSWNGNDYSITGSYSITLVNSLGCDSVATLNLTVNDNSASTSTATVCSNQLPYSWNGNDYSATGSYSITLINSLGCDSVATLNLTVNDNSASTSIATVCSNQLPYSWNGNDYSTTGSYSITLVNSLGCDSVATLNLTVNDNSVSTSTATICSNQLPYSWNGNDYSTSGLYAITLINSLGCDSVATLNLTVNINSSSTNAASICSNQLPYSWNGNNYSTSGLYAITLINSLGCDSVATLNLTVNDNSASTSTATVCSNQLPYSWNGNNYSTSGSYAITLINSLGCDSVANLYLNVNNPVASTTTIAVCNSELPYSWNDNIYNLPGIYSLTFPATNGCDSIATLVLSVNPATTSTTNINICNNQLPYSWNGNSYSAAGIYPITLINSSGCDSIATLILSSGSVVTSATNISICNNQLPYSWNGNSYPTAGVYNVTLIGSSGCDSIATLNLTLGLLTTSTTNVSICSSQLPYSWNGNSYSTAGTYSVSLTGNSGCDSIATLMLTSNSVVTSTTNITICSSQLPYIWNGNSYSTAGTYSVSLTGNSGCDSIATLILTSNSIVTSTTNITICNSQLPYNWNGNSYPTAGTFSVSLTGSSGCDSIATLILTSNSVVTSTTNITVCNSQLPYSWNGNSCPTAGTYSVSLTGSSGCDSIATLILTGNSMVTSTTNITVCNSQLPYSWNGNSYSTAGTYSVFLTGSSGCDSIATLILTSNSVVISTTNITACNTQLPYSWNGNSYPTAGTFSVSLTGSSGCDSIAILILTTNSVVISTTNITVCNTQLPYSWNGNTYPTAGTYSVSLTGSSGCDSIATLILTSNSIVTSTTNITICNNQLPYSWNGNSYSIPGTYSVTLTSNLGCDSIATLNLSSGSVLTSTTNISICNNQLPLTWNGSSYTIAGTYSANLFSNSGCDSIATLNLVVHEQTTSTTSAIICSNQLPYSWNGNDYQSAGNYTVILTGSNGCDSIAVLNLSVNATPAMPGVNDVAYCQYDPTSVLSANNTTPGNQLLWYTTAIGGTGLTTAPQPGSGMAGAVTYYVSQTENGCESPRADITVTVNPKPGLGPDQQLKICTGQTTNISGLYDVNGLAFNWTHENEPVTNLEETGIAGNYQLIVQNDSGCEDTANVQLAINPSVTANAGPDGIAQTNAAYQLSGSGAEHYQWSPAASLNDPFISNPVATLDHDQTFILLAMDDIGCFDLDTVNIRVLDGPTFYIPSAFTPNGDGINDQFGPTTIGIRGLDFFRIYNRYGELVFETQDISKKWNGIYKGKRQPMGNYAWHLTGTDKFGRKKTMKGNVVLIR